MGISTRRKRQIDRLAHMGKLVRLAFFFLLCSSGVWQQALLLAEPSLQPSTKILVNQAWELEKTSTATHRLGHLVVPCLLTWADALWVSRRERGSIQRNASVSMDTQETMGQSVPCVHTCSSHTVLLREKSGEDAPWACGREWAVVSLSLRQRYSTNKEPVRVLGSKLFTLCARLLTVSKVCYVTHIIS